MKREIWVFLCLAIFGSKLVMAYPQFIAHGYNTCLTCHYNPLGGGPLNDYGRALGSNTISDRLFVDEDMSEDELAKYSGFFFKENKSAIKPYANYRGLYIIRDFNGDNSDSEYIQMEAKLGFTTEWGKDKKYIFSGSMSYNPGRSDNENEDKFRSREHYIGYRPKKNWGVYVGLLDKAFGLRIPDHNAFSKSVTNLAQDDQTHGVLFSYLAEKWNVNVHAFVGNMTQDAELRQVGGSARFEYNFSKSYVVGASLLSSSSDFLEQSTFSVHTKMAPSKNMSIMAEFGINNKASAVNATEDNGMYFFSQHHIRMSRGLYYFTSLEYYEADNANGQKTMVFGPGIQWFPIQKVEIRAELRNQRVFADNNVEPDTWFLFGQVHLWF